MPSLITIRAHGLVWSVVGMGFNTKSKLRLIETATAAVATIFIITDDDEVDGGKGNEIGDNLH